MKARITLFSLLLLALPLSGFSQSTLNYPRLFTVADLGSTGFAVVNPSSATANITFTMYSAAGVPVASTPTTIAAGGQIVKLASELFPSANAPAWVQATSSTTGLQGFWLGGDLNNRSFLDGAEAAPVGQEFIFPLATATTELNLANLSTSTNIMDIRIYGGSGGTPLFSTTQAVGVNGIFKTTLQALAPSVNYPNARYVKVTGTGNFTGTTVVVDFIHAPSWSVVNGISTSLAATEANFPHVPSGPEDGGAKWTSYLGITNLASSTQTVTITFNRISGGSVSTTQTLAANGSLRETVKDLFTFGSYEEGWVKVTGTAPLGGFVAYGYSGTGGVAVVPVQTVPQTRLIFSHVANDGITWGSGLALLNATSVDATVEVYVMQLTGGLVGGAQSDLQAAFTIPAGTKYVKLLNELVPLARDNAGFVYVKSSNNVPLYALELFFDVTQQAIANVAAGAVDPSITFVPPAPSGTIPTLPPLTITAVTPSPVSRGTALTITGTGFSATPGSNTVRFASSTGSVPATPTTATPVSLTVTVPATAITGPVYMTTGGRFSNSVVLAVTATSTTTVTSDVSVFASQNTFADIYVSPPVATLNASALGISETSENSATISGSSVEAPAGVSRRLWINGAGVTSSTTVTISGSGITISPSGLTAADFVIVNIAVASGATLGPRNIILKNSNLDTSIITGGLIVR